MKNLAEAFVILKHAGGVYDFFEGSISFDKEELEQKCDKLNEATIIGWKKNWEADKRHKNKPFQWNYSSDFNPYQIMNLKEAIEKYGNDVADYHAPDSPDN